MKTYIKLVLASFFLFGLYSCANSKKIKEEAPVSVQNPFYTITIVGGDQIASVVELYLPVSSEPHSSIVLDSVYFQRRIAKLQLRSEEAPNVFVGKFEILSINDSDSDMIMSKDPREEYGNKPPIVLRDFPFDLESNQAVVQYQEAGEVKYFKVFDIEKKEVDAE